MTAQLSTIIAETATAMYFRDGLTNALRNGSHKIDSYTVANGTGAKYTIWVLADTDEAIRITSSKSGKDFRTNDLQPNGTIGRNHGFAKHHFAMDAIADRINEVGVIETIRTLSEGICCACCGSPLTDDLSRSRGIGPICWGRLCGKGSAWTRYIAKLTTDNRKVAA